MTLSQQSKNQRAEVMQKHSHSIVNKVLSNIPINCVMKATIHVLLGITRTIVYWTFLLYDWTFLLYKQLENMESGSDFMRRDTIEKALVDTTKTIMRAVDGGAITHNCCCGGTSEDNG